MTAELQKEVDSRLKLIQREGVQAWYQLSSEVRERYSVSPFLFVLSYSDEAGKKHTQRVLDAVGPQVASATGIYQLVATNGSSTPKWKSGDDPITAKLVLCGGRIRLSSTIRLICEMFTGFDRSAATSLAVDLLDNDDADLFAAGQSRPRMVNMERANLPAAAYQFKRMDVPMREARVF